MIQLVKLQIFKNNQIYQNKRVGIYLFRCIVAKREYYTHSMDYNVNGRIIKLVQKFRYLGAIIQKNGGTVKVVESLIKCGWNVE